MEHSEADLRNKDAKSRRVREIGSLGSVENVSRRESCRKSVQRFAKTYFPRLVERSFSSDHKEVLDRAQRTIQSRGRFAYAMSRGMGKSTLMMILVLWAVLYGWARYIIIITSEITLGHDFLQAIADELQDNELLLSDFPELKYLWRWRGSHGSRVVRRWMGGRRSYDCRRGRFDFRRFRIILRIRYKYVKIYVNEWKTQLSQMCNLPPTSPGSLTLFGKDPMRHAMYLRHLASEYPSEVEGRGIKIDVWQLIPHMENHIFR